MINKIKLKKARNKIDKLDKNIFRLIKQRTKIVKHMLSLKRYKSEIIDKKRMNEVFRYIKKRQTKVRGQIKKTFVAFLSLKRQIGSLYVHPHDLFP